MGGLGVRYEVKRNLVKKRELAAPPVPNAANCPVGTYLGSCTGCTVDEGELMLTCTQCKVR